MPNQSRLGDTIKISCPHGTQVGIITSGSHDLTIDSIPCARFFDSTICCSCGGSGQIISGSSDSIVDNLMKARVGDQEIGTCQLGCKECNHTHNGVIIQGSSDTTTD